MNFPVSSEKAESLIIVTERKQRPMIMLTVLKWLSDGIDSDLTLQQFIWLLETDNKTLNVQKCHTNPRLLKTSLFKMFLRVLVPIPDYQIT